jgi:methylthioribose-1-phosphate isomerase
LREHLGNAARYLVSSRPTAVNLGWAVNKVLRKLEGIPIPKYSVTALETALEI